MTITKWYRFRDCMINIDVGEINIMELGEEGSYKIINISDKELIALKRLIDEAYSRAVKEKLCPICRNLGVTCNTCDYNQRDKFDPVKPEEIELG
jgi:hypothetical protein